jgi:hypothetical protein
MRRCGFSLKCAVFVAALAVLAAEAEAQPVRTFAELSRTLAGHI